MQTFYFFTPYHPCGSHCWGLNQPSDCEAYSVTVLPPYCYFILIICIFVSQLRCLSMNILGSLPDGLKEYVKMLLSSTPTVRPDADQLSKVINRGCVCI